MDHAHYKRGFRARAQSRCADSDDHARGDEQDRTGVHSIGAPGWGVYPFDGSIWSSIGHCDNAPSATASSSRAPAITSSMDVCKLFRNVEGDESSKRPAVTKVIEEAEERAAAAKWDDVKRDMADAQNFRGAFLCLPPDMAERHPMRSKIIFLHVSICDLEVIRMRFRAIQPPVFTISAQFKPIGPHWDRLLAEIAASIVI